MNNKTGMFAIAGLILALITAAILGVVSSPSNLLTWLLVLSVAPLLFIYRRMSA